MHYKIILRVLRTETEYSDFKAKPYASLLINN